ncbi:MAG: type II CRISPR RNA-guided endonuclease Cas9 [Olegusella sp.]|nr:type II CRISPR RNA-guided endonuclease Cas9 [Olegusella sp.]
MGQQNQEMANARHYLVLGLDPGIASCGFCLLDMTDHKILEMGSHLFDAPQNPKSKQNLSVERRNARSARRNLKRTRDRQKKCLELLKQCGLSPSDADKQWLQSRKGDKPVIKLRASALDRTLTDRELAQVLYSLTGRRGYIPHGEGHLDDVDDAEAGKVLAAVRENQNQMAKKGYRTVGQMLYKEGRSRNRGGDYTLCVLNSQIIDEAKIILDEQRSHGNAILTKMSNGEFEQFTNSYIDCLTWEKKSTKHDERVYSLVGACTYFPEEKRAAEADLSSELCRAYERFGHLVMVDADGTEHRLSAKDRARYLQILFSPVPIRGNKDCKVTYATIRKDLDLSAHVSFKGIEAERENKEEPFSPRRWRKLRACGVPEGLLARMLEDRDLADSIGEALAYASTEESLRDKLSSLDLSDDEINQLAVNVPFAGKLFSGYGSRSLKALHMLLDMFEDESILTLDDAERESGLQALRLADKGHRSLNLPPYDIYDPTCNNPTVLRALGRMRRIVNAIIRIYGVPDEIHIELGKELKQSSKEKKSIAKSNLQNKKDNERIAKTIAELLGCSPDDVRGKQIRRFALREEQGCKDAYTGDSIDLMRMLTEDRYTEIDHILPYSRTCDDSRANKVLVLQKSNQDKKERTPWEWMSDDASKGAPDWEEFKARTLTNHRLSYKKRDHLLNQNLNGQEQSFIDRNLNDTRYMSVAVKDYLEKSLLFPDDGRKSHVIAVAGGATSALRHVWGLNFGADNTKDRSDDRHHAVDAAVIAACSQATVKKVADTSKLGHSEFKRKRESRLADTQPWPTFADEVIARREFVIPTRMANHGVTGSAFEDTIYRYEGIREGKDSLAVLSKSQGKDKPRAVKPSGNYRLDADGGAHLYDGIAFLRFWLDAEARPKGKVKGKWLIEPVYYADIPLIQCGRYIPKYIPAAHLARDQWVEIPESVLATDPVTVFFGDVLYVDGHIGRYSGFNINGLKLTMHSVISGESIAFPPVSSTWSKDSEVRIIEEDVLGRCWTPNIAKLVRLQEAASSS